MAEMTRREWGTLAALAAGGVAVAPEQAVAQQTASGQRDYVAEQLDSMARDAAELKKVPISYSDEPIFALVVR